MKIEVEIPDLETLLEFTRVKPPEGVTVSEYSVALHGDGASGFTTIMIDFGVQVASGVITGLILAAFSKHHKKNRDHKPRINYRETRLEYREIFRIIEEERTTQDADKEI